MLFKALNNKVKEIMGYFLNLNKVKRSQSALEYMMTYGWAILIIVIVAVILYSMGIFNPSSSISITITGFQQTPVSSAICTPKGVLVVSLEDATGNLINVTAVNSTVNGKVAITHPNQLINPGNLARVLILGGCSNISNTHFSSQIKITYTEPGQQLPGPYVSTGSITGTTSSFVQNTVAEFVVNKSQIYIPNSTTMYNMWQGGPYTFSVWVNLTYDSPSCQHYPCVALLQVEYGCTSGLQDYMANSSGFWTNELEWNVTHTSCANGQTSPTVFVPFNNWILITGIFGYNTSSSSYYLTICVDAKCEESPYTLDHPGYQGTGAMSIGAYQLSGEIANVQLYDQVLSQNQIKTIFDEGYAGIPPTTNGLIAWLPLDGNANDYSGNNNNGITTKISWVSP